MCFVFSVKIRKEIQAFGACVKLLNFPHNHATDIVYTGLRDFFRNFQIWDCFRNNVSLLIMTAVFVYFFV